MILLFVVAHVVMSRTSIGRYVYAVGGNPEAARLSGVPVKWVLVFVYALCGLLAGLGGVMEASLHVTGDPKSELWLNCRSSQPLSLGERVWQAEGERYSVLWLVLLSLVLSEMA